MNNPSPKSRKPLQYPIVKSVSDLAPIRSRQKTGSLSVPRKNPDDAHKNMGTTPVSTRFFEDAVDDAQYLVAYAVSKASIKIKAEDIAILIDVKHRVDMGQQISSQLKAKFWSSYQEVWDLVKPATAESIKANLPLEKTFLGRLLTNVPFLSQWTSGWTISRARKSVGLYIAFTTLVLLSLLVVQIYWVIGNQLTSQLNGLLVKRAELAQGLDTNEKEYEIIMIRYPQADPNLTGASESSAITASIALERDILENRSANDGIKKDLVALNSQIDRSLKILSKWSCPWAPLIDSQDAVQACSTGGADSEQDTNQPAQKTSDPAPGSLQCTGQDVAGPHTAKYRARFDDIDSKIMDIQNRCNQGDVEVVVENQNNPIEDKIKAIDAQIRGLNDQLHELESKHVSVNSRLAEISKFLTAREELLRLGERWQSTSVGSQAEADVEREIGEFVDVLLVADLGDRGAKRLSLKCLYSMPTGTNNPDTHDASSNCNPINGEVPSTYDPTKIQIGYSSLMPEVAGEIFARVNSEKSDLENSLVDLDNEITDKKEQIHDLDSDQETLRSQKIKGVDVIEEWNKEWKDLIASRNQLIAEEKEDVARESSLAAQLAGQFVLNVLQSYILPILYGLLGASTYVLRSLSRKINDVTYSGVTGTQHILSISLGALTGIMVGWFSFLIPNESTSFLGSVSPLAIAFLVGYNIEFFFSRMDLALERAKAAPMGPIEAKKKNEPVDQPTPQPRISSPARKKTASRSAKSK